MKSRHLPRTYHSRSGDGISSIASSLLAYPLEFLCAEHLREREVCFAIDQMTRSASFDPRVAQNVLRFVTVDLSVHMQDEAEDLFPMMARRCPPEDSIGRAISRVRSDLDEAAQLLPELRAALVRCLDTGSALSPEDRDVLTGFTGHARRHLAAENAIILPIARARLKRRDLQKLSRHMHARRGLPPFLEPTHAC